LKEILILSGKGGTGKTSFAASFIYFAERCIVCDYDVDASNLPILLKPRSSKGQEFSGGERAVINREACIECGLCADLCRFDAIREYSVNQLLCEGCAFCYHICPVNAVAMEERPSGNWFEGTAAAGSKEVPVFFAELRPGEENSGKLVARVKSAARDRADKENFPLIISDGPPGIGCPVISALVGIDLAVIVAEPSVSGFHDIQRLSDLLELRGVKSVLVINKYDLNPDTAEDMEKWAAVKGISCAGKVAFSTVLAEAVAEGEIPVTRSEVYPLIFPVWQKILEKLKDEK